MKLRKKLRKKLRMFSAIVMVLTIMSSTYAYASTIVSSSKYKTENGYDYQFFAYGTINGSNELYGGTTCRSDDNLYIPANYMAVQANLYRSSGAMIYASDYVYNTSSAVSVGVQTPTTSTPATYYSLGYVLLYNGSNYTQYDTYSTSSIVLGGTTTVSMLNSNTAIETNVRGETFGSNIIASQLDIELDLILAIGENDVTGYVRATDLRVNVVDHPDDAYIITTNRSIPLYQSDGTTVIGSFIVNNENNSIVEQN